MKHDVAVLFIMAVCGVVCSVVFDFFRALHIKLKKHNIAVAVTDIIFWFFMTFAIVFCLSRFNSGIVRGYEIVGFVTGAVLYFCTASTALYRLFCFLIEKICVFMRFILKIVLTLISFLYKILVMPFIRFSGAFKSIIKGIGKRKLIKSSEAEN